jgi:hypothetical protein
MQDRPDDFRDSFYFRAIRTRIGAALQAQYDLEKPLPDRISDLLSKLDQADASRSAGNEAGRRGADVRKTQGDTR